MTFVYLLLGAMAFALGWRCRQWLMRGRGMGASTSPAEIGSTQSRKSDYAASSSIKRNSSALPSKLTASLAPGAYVGLAELHRFAELRGQIGYLLSDHLIALFSAEIEKSLPNCVLGRVGRKSVEFVFSAKNDDDASARLEQISRDVESKLTIDGCQIGLVSHFGAVRIAENGSRATDFLLHQAETALTGARQKRVRALIGNEGHDTAETTRSNIAINDFPRAIAQGEFALFYQPKLQCRADKVFAVEALLRWQHPEHGLIPTEKLIKIAEATGAIRDLTRWVINQAVADQSQFDSIGLDVSIDVNFSGSLLTNAELIAWSLDRLTSTARPMGIEVTETAVINDPDTAIGNLRLFAEAGVRIAIDDYGTGLSSLVYLKQLPASELKIDRAFVSGLTESHRDPLIIRSTIDLAHALEMEVTAEGVDDPMAFALLRAMGCDIVQGYLIAKPMPFAAMCTFLQEWQGSDQHAPQRMLG